MPLLDVTAILSDPDLSDTFDVIRRNETVDPATGRSVTTELRIPNIAGVVTPGDQGSLLRKDDSSSSDRVISIATVYRLRSIGAGFQPDVVLYDGIRFTVKAAQYWHRFGQGFTNAVAISSNASDPEPT